MSKQKYCDLIDSLCERFQIEDSKSMYEACNIQIEEIPFTLLHANYIDDDSMIAYCDFGELPTEKRQPILEHLLTANLMMSSKMLGVACNPENGHVMMLRRFLLSRTTTDELLMDLGEMAFCASEWRDNYVQAITASEGSTEKPLA